MDPKRMCFLNSNDGSGLLAFGKGELLEVRGLGTLEETDAFLNKHKGKYIFLALSYDIKNQIEKLESDNSDEIEFPDALIWSPDAVVGLEEGKFVFLQGTESEENRKILQEFLEPHNKTPDKGRKLHFVPRIPKEEYINTVNALKEHIQKGDIYEVNYCQEFNSYNTEIEDSINTYLNLNNITKTPFSAYLSVGDFEVYCGSPERFIKRKNDCLIAQPIKGTIRRGKSIEEDEALKEQLYHDPKERAENVMIVDLMRNDLSKVACKDSVKVDELYGIYSFETLHQMISTISCSIPAETTFVDILKASFPMGSMTGAPKIRAMELIERYETFKRGLFSGSIGYIAPNGDFDLNVVIRTLVYNRRLNSVSCAVGSAVTIQSDAEKEYKECLLKIQKIIDAV